MAPRADSAGPDTRFEPGDRVVVVRSCLAGDRRLIGLRGKIVSPAPGGFMVRFGGYWKGRLETCFIEELERDVLEGFVARILKKCKRAARRIAVP